MCHKEYHPLLLHKENFEVQNRRMMDRCSRLVDVCVGSVDPPREPERIDRYHWCQHLPRELPAHPPPQYIPHTPRLLIHHPFAIKLNRQVLTSHPTYIPPPPPYN